MTNNSKLQEYKVLARKYRPQKFQDLVGQDALVQTITNAIIKNRIAHAYLLTGVRGVGKTTTARLISMSLNCEKKSDESTEPCGECDTCASIKEDRNIDVIEMDAASKTGVDDVREIIENVKYKPVSCKYKIFIIDEVHMLSRNAFNALLKTLEEPPPHVKFLFATTEVKKIPITIISRCQRFDLQRIESSELTQHLFLVAKNEKIEINEGAIALIVRSADGSVRDGLSLLDQAIVNEKNNITSKTIINMLGLADRIKIFDLLDNILKGEANKSLNIYRELFKSGSDVTMIFDEMLKVTHFLTQLKISSDLINDIHIPEEERKKGSEMIKLISISSLGIVWQVLFKGYQELSYGYNLYQLGEMIIIRLIFLYDGPSPDDLIKKIEEKIEKNEVEKFVYDNNNDKSSQTPKTINKIDSNETNESKHLSRTAGNVEIKNFRKFVNLFYSNKEGILFAQLYNEVKLISFEEGKIIINVEKITDRHFSRTVAKLISKWTGRIWQVGNSNSNVGQTLYEEDIIKQQDEIKLMKNNSVVQNILNKYPGITIHSITSISETGDDKINFDTNKIKKEK